jgi:hypothetical protein
MGRVHPVPPRRETIFFLGRESRSDREDSSRRKPLGKGFHGAAGIFEVFGYFVEHYAAVGSLPPASGRGEERIVDVALVAKVGKEERKDRFRVWARAKIQDRQPGFGKRHYAGMGEFFQVIPISCGAFTVVVEEVALLRLKGAGYVPGVKEYEAAVGTSPIPRSPMFF